MVEEPLRQPKRRPATSYLGQGVSHRLIMLLIGSSLVAMAHERSVRDGDDLSPPTRSLFRRKYDGERLVWACPIRHLTGLSSKVTSRVMHAQRVA